MKRMNNQWPDHEEPRLCRSKAWIIVVITHSIPRECNSVCVYRCVCVCVCVYGGGNGGIHGESCF